MNGASMPLLGRFMTPIRSCNLGDLQSYNRYSYVSNDPLASRSSGYRR